MLPAPLFSRHPRGTTLAELVVVCALVALLAALATPRVRDLLDRLEVRGAVDEIVAACATARHLAILRSQPAMVVVDGGAGTVTVVLAADTLVHRDLAASFGVRLAATRDTLTYAPSGLAYGVSNLSVAVTRGRAADTVVVSRLGRVRR